MPQRLLAIALAFTALIAASDASALKFVPFVQEFAPRGPNSKKVYRIENDGPEQVAIQVSMVHRTMKIDGTEDLIEAEDDFIVFPPQLVLEPGESRTVRVQWLGDPDPKIELAYRIIAEQLPVDFGNNSTAGSHVTLLVRYEGAVYIAPKGVASDVALESAEAKRGADGSRKLVLTVQNKGNAHTLLRNLSLNVRSRADGSQTTIPGEKLDGMRGENVLAGHRRRFELAWPKDVTFGPVDVNLSFTVSR